MTLRGMWGSQRQVLALALPMLLSNLTVPLLGLVDTWVIGHLDSPTLLGGVAVGATLINLTWWVLGFLRMSTTGLTAQALGADDGQEMELLLGRGLLMACLLALVLLLGKAPLVSLALGHSGASAQVQHYASEYLAIRLCGAPAALSNLVVLGWLLGRHDTKGPMWLLIAGNALNIVLDLLLVQGLGWRVAGVATASLLADYAMLLLGLWLVHRQVPLPQLGQRWRTGLFALAPYRRLLALNRDIFIRALCLQCCFAFMTFQGARLGDLVVAANAVLLNFLMLLSYGLDGFAYAAEAMVGRAVGARRRDWLWVALRDAFAWALAIALLATLLFAVGGEWLVASMTTIEAVVEEARRYLPWLVAMPLLSVWCYLFDGVFIGATRVREMRDTMLLAVVLGYLPVWWWWQGAGNGALWGALAALMVGRGLGQGIWLYRLWHSRILVD